ncbi:protein yellow-like [Cloeon dipterum]|uniref:protein yellow-like n=1 Tax=Cloeon dipterum TaxID=197152 RepID=UPI0032209421
MSPFYAAIFLHGLCLANAINFTTIYEWDKFDFAWPSGANSSDEQIEQNLNSSEVYFRFMAVVEERLFLNLDPSPGIPATLVWLPTSGMPTEPPKLNPFPSWDLSKKDNNCDTIQEARGMKADTDGRLWVLDLGSSECPSKLWIFDLANDTIERVHQFPDTVVSHSHSKRWLSDIVIDKTADDDYLAYIADYSSEHIVVYYLKTDLSWPVKTPEFVWQCLALSPNQEARQLLYLNRRSWSNNELYSVSVSELENEAGSAAVKFIGNFTETPYRMLMDSANVLYAAFYNQNYLSKWNISEPFHEQRVHEAAGELGAGWPFTFALDASDTLWMMERNQSGNETKHKLLKAAVGAKDSAYSQP